MPRVISLAGLILLACAIAFAQPAESKLTFEVASVKLSTVPPAGPPNSDGGPGTRYPERYASFTTLRNLLFRAFGLVDAQQQISGPGWIDSERYAIEARVPPGTTKEQFQIMLRNLLVERFKLEVHHGTRVLSVYELLIAKNGPKFKESTADAAPARPESGADPNEFPAIPAGQPGLAQRFGTGASGRPITRWRVQQQTMSAFAGALGLPANAGLPVIDKTGLTGKYDFTLYHDIQEPGAPSPAAGDSPSLTIFEAIEQQLGLKLVAAKAPFDTVVIDHAERMPTEN